MVLRPGGPLKDTRPPANRDRPDRVQHPDGEDPELAKGNHMARFERVGGHGLRYGMAAAVWRAGEAWRAGRTAGPSHSMNRTSEPNVG